MKYKIDRFNFRRQALIKSLAFFDFTNETSILGFEINGTEPEDCARRVIFEVDGVLYKFGTNGVDEYKNLGELDDILKYGNTVAELLAVEDIPEWVGKKVYVIVAMDAPEDSPVFPQFKIAAKVKSFNDVYTKYEYSPIYQLTERARVIEILTSKVTRGNGVATVQVRLKNPVTGWGDWIFPGEARFKSAAAIQIRVQYILTALDGSDFAQVQEVIVNYSTDETRLLGGCEVISQPITYDGEVKTVYAQMQGADRAFVKFEQPLTLRENVPLDSQNPYLAKNGVIDKGVAQDTIRLTKDGKPLDDFYFDTENSSIGNVASDGELAGSYYCNVAAENWQAMEKNGDRFIYRGTIGGFISAVKFQCDSAPVNTNFIIGWSV